MAWVEHWAVALGYVGAALSILASSMRTMIPLRCLGLVTNCVFLVYGGMLGLYPTLIVNGVLLPLNATRLVQMLRLTRKVKAAASCDLSMDWLKPFMTRRTVKAGETLFAKGDEATCMFYTLTGRFRLAEIGLELTPGQVVGEMGLIAPENRRTQSLVCTGDGEVLTISYADLRQLYFQNPEFGFYFLRLTSSRLFQNLASLESEVMRLRAERGDVARAA